MVRIEAKRPCHGRNHHSLHETSFTRPAFQHRQGRRRSCSWFLRLLATSLEQSAASGAPRGYRMLCWLLHFPPTLELKAGLQRDVTIAAVVENDIIHRQGDVVHLASTPLTAIQSPSSKLHLQIALPPYSFPRTRHHVSSCSLYDDLLHAKSWPRRLIIRDDKATASKYISDYIIRTST